MTNVERFWEASVAEAVSNRHPPDQAAEILARLNAPPEPAKRKRVARWIRYPVELAAAAALIVAIGFATGLIKWPEETVEKPDPERTWVAGPGAEVKETETGLLLESGSMLLKTGSPEVRRGESLFTNLEGVAVVQAGGTPSDEDHAAIQQWLHERKVDEAMIARATRWAAGAAMCVLMLQGTAQLDGQEVKAQNEPASAPVWHTVHSAMDLDRLPKDAKYVEVIGLSGGYLPLVADYKHLEGVAFRGTELLSSHVTPLSALPNLRVLDLRGSEWYEVPGPTMLDEFKALKEAGLDIPDPSDDEYMELPRKLASRGVELRAGLREGVEELVPILRKEFPDIEDIHFGIADDAACRELAAFKKLRRLTLTDCTATELGYAHLGRISTLEYLNLEINSGRNDETPLKFVHHLGKIKSLQSLALSSTRRTNNGSGVEAGVLSVLGSMTQLRHLTLSWHYWEPLARIDGRGITPFANSANLETFEIAVPAVAVASEQSSGLFRHPFDIPGLVGARRTTIHLYDDQRIYDDKPHARIIARPYTLENPVSGSNEDTMARVQEVVCLATYIDRSHSEALGAWVEGLNRYPNLKRVTVNRSDVAPYYYDSNLPPGRVGSPDTWYGGKVAALLRERLEGLEVIDAFTR